MKSSTAKRLAIALSLPVLLLGVFASLDSSTTTGRTSPPQRCSEVDDATLADNVTAKISERAGLAGQNIKVEARSGVITLKGNVSSKSKRQLARRVARDVRCVKSIASYIEVMSVIQRPNYTCCCEEGCWTQSRPCPQCRVKHPCFEVYNQAMKAAGRNEGARSEARKVFYKCIEADQ